MRTIIFISLLFLGTAANSHAQTDLIELDGLQSMCITGKGPGQDAAINPYTDGPSVAVLKNVGKNPFDYRVERNGEIIETARVLAKKKAVISLQKGDQLFFDSDNPTTVKVGFTRRSNEPFEAQ